MSGSSIRPVKAVLFDYGHTLVDMPGWPEYLALQETRVGEHLGEQLQALTDGHERLAKALRATASLHDQSYLQGEIEEQVLRDLYRQGFGSVGLELDEADLDAIVDIDHAISAEAFSHGSHAAETLNALRRKGIRMGIVSNNIYLVDKARALWPLLRETDAHFDVVIFSSDAGLAVRKPHPAIYRAALAGLGADPAEVVFVGDRLREDVQGPMREGMQRAFLTHEYRQEEDPAGEAARVLTRLDELLDEIA